MTDTILYDVNAKLSSVYIVSQDSYFVIRIVGRTE